MDPKSPKSKATTKKRPASAAAVSNPCAARHEAVPTTVDRRFNDITDPQPATHIPDAVSLAVPEHRPPGSPYQSQSITVAVPEDSSSIEVLDSLTPSDGDSASVQSEIDRLVDRERRGQGEPPLTWQEADETSPLLTSEVESDSEVSEIPHMTDRDQEARAQAMGPGSIQYLDGVIPLRSESLDYPEKYMPIQIKTLGVMATHLASRVRFTVRIKGIHSVRKLKLLIQERVNIHPKNQSLICKGKRLENHKRLQSYGIFPKAVIELGFMAARSDTDVDSIPTDDISD